jgi:uncharacterized protein (DUF433 family)
MTSPNGLAILVLVLNVRGGAMEYHQYIVRDPKVCGGDPTVKGTRVTVRTLLASLAEGDTVEELLKDFPTLKEEDIRAVVAFAAASAEKDLPLHSVPDLP